MTVLDEIVAYKKTLLSSGYYELKLNQFEAIDVSAKQKLSTALQSSSEIGVIAEIKSKSPTVSDIPQKDLKAQLDAYSNASAISILTDEAYFEGSYERLYDLTQQTKQPVLCKDFMIDKRQIDLAKKTGASIILLIVNILSDEKLHELYNYACDLNLEVLIEVHSKEELKRAHQLQPELIGINNRDLKTFITDVNHTADILQTKRPNTHYISESGIRSREDIERLTNAGISGVLVGETLMKAEDPHTLIESFKVKKG
ncbi:indole-3-glycerol phosphate synthase TrpC [Staphylococcus felis]|uniref:Indole-3-glycerol phosphate synthase n=1 Tax=Staphylococcus felis TaxID=46127 RepID=A0A3E0IRI3_9STAP|nr:indole-3-glycerol phosphate synthase TrpC [Staphylococcus felis]REH94003.1 indole-3-glycerol phosphate synthase TrpC [Staphylococcus felis]REH98922.1 indole-3-glycerol phosphate synthase TrpC [Staphylococcus felis]REI30297.1 indole-3-glycerol phosphate synthase TrpC [Staphylococcus felis]